MKKILVKILALAVVAGMMFSSATLTAEAKTKKATKATVTQTVDTKNTIDANLVAQVFDAEYYATQYPDVVAVLGNDPVKLLNHYIKNGIKEGRDASATFNASVYALANPDLITVFGNDYGMFIAHYVVNGKTEGRAASVADLEKLGSKQINALMSQSAELVKANGYEGSFNVISAGSTTAPADANISGTVYNAHTSWVQSGLDAINRGVTVESIGLDKYGWTNEGMKNHYEYAAQGVYYNPVTGYTQAYGTSVDHYTDDRGVTYGTTVNEFTGRVENYFRCSDETFDQILVDSGATFNEDGSWEIK